MPAVSIIICTRDRATSLRETLASIERVDLAGLDEVELLIVDNGSTDGTRELASAYRSERFGVRYVSVPTKGKGFAYNAGLAAARGTICLFTDDDVRVPQNWVTGMCEPIRTGAADAVQGGIRIAPHLERPWLRGMLRIWVASVEDPERAPEGLVGANMAFTKAAAEQVGGFDTRLGPGASGFFDDTLFGWALVNAGRRIAYRPAIAVEHHFEERRLNLAAFLDSARKMAVSRAMVDYMMDPTLPDPPAGALLRILPGLAFRWTTQQMRSLRGEPDVGYVARYFQWRYWRARRDEFRKVGRSR